MSDPESVGQQLRARREAMHLSLDEVAEATKIRSWYLAALEDDNRQRLPADVYALGFLRAYARHLGLDANDLVDRWRALGNTPPRASSAPNAEPAAPGPAPAGRPARPRATPRPRRQPSEPAPRSPRAGGERGPVGLWVAGMLLGVVVVGLVLVLLHHSAAPAPVSVAPRTTTPAKPKARTPHKKTAPVHHHKSSAGSSSSTPPASTPTSGVTLVSQTAGLTTYQAAAGPITLNLSFSQPCWVEAWVNGTTSNPYGHVYQAGQSLTITGSQSVEVRLGAPAYATLVANGQTLAALGPNVTDVLIQVG